MSDIEGWQSFLAAVGNSKPTGFYFFSDENGNYPMLDVLRKAAKDEQRYQPVFNITMKEKKDNG